jgi:hypothetical protein
MSVKFCGGFERRVCCSVYEAVTATEKIEDDYSEKQMYQNSCNMCIGTQ